MENGFANAIRTLRKKKWLIIVPLLFISTGIYMAYSAARDEAVIVSGDDYASGYGAYGGEETDGDGQAETFNDNSEYEAEETGKIFVDVGGAVAAPQVVMLDEGARIYEAVEAAGGTLPDAETKYMNLAAVCEDGAKIYVPSASEIEDRESSGDDSVLFSSEMPSDSIYGTSAGSGGKSDNNTAKVNINTADSAELQTLTGIGPSMAQRIIDYRETNGSFTSVDDLKKVSGIGEKTLSKFIEKICV